MLDENNAINTADTPEPQPPEETGNRTFLIVGGIIAALILVTLICMAVYFLVIAPRLASSQASQAATAEAQRLEQAQAMTETAVAALATPEIVSSPMPSATKTKVVPPAATFTLVVVLATPQNSPVNDPATLAAMQTQLSGQMTQTSAALLGTRAIGGEAPLPTTGFFDEVGLPLLLVLTFALLVVIFIARRMRKAPGR
jgi:type II secretory pathway pseudopilin PulG